MRISLLTCVMIVCSMATTAWSQAMPVIPEPVVAPNWQPVPIDRIEPMGWLKTEVDLLMSIVVSNKDALQTELSALDRFGSPMASNLNQANDLRSIEGSLQWLIGLVDLAILSGNPELTSLTSEAIDRLRGRQEANGYLGIFPPEKRYQINHVNDNLYTQALALQALLTWHDHAPDPALLLFVERTVQDAYLHFPYRQQAVPDPAHPAMISSLAMIDVLANLYARTGKMIYQEFTRDLLHAAILHPGSVLSAFIRADGLEDGVGPVHCATLRWLAKSRSMTSDIVYLDAFQRGLVLIREHTGPAGALHGSLSNDNFTSTQELLHTCASLLTFTADLKYAEWIENLILNTFPVSLLPHSDGLFKYIEEEETQGFLEQITFTSVSAPEASPVLANWTHVYPDFIRSLWCKDNQGLICAAFAPCELETSWGNRQVRIQEILDYPGDYQLRLNVQTDSACTFMVKIRKPEWARAITINQPYTIVGDFIHVEKEWRDFEEISIVFAPGISSHRTNEGHRWFRFGPLVLAHPIPAEEILPAGASPGMRKFKAEPAFSYSINSTAKPARPHASDPGDHRFSFSARRSDNNQEETIRMVPLRNTLFRQTTFPEFKH